MVRFVQSLGDRMLRLLVPEVEAGACVPFVGQQCGTCDKNGEGRCRNGLWEWKKVWGGWNCLGTFCTKYAGPFCGWEHTGAPC